MTKYLYSASLEKHLDVYMENVKLTQFNEEYQLLQNQIIFEAERMNMTQAEIVNKLQEMREALKLKIENKIIPTSATDVEDSIKNISKLAPKSQKKVKSELTSNLQIGKVPAKSKKIISNLISELQISKVPAKSKKIKSSIRNELISLGTDKKTIISILDDLIERIDKNEKIEELDLREIIYNKLNEIRKKKNTTSQFILRGRVLKELKKK